VFGYLPETTHIRNVNGTDFHNRVPGYEHSLREDVGPANRNPEAIMRVFWAVLAATHFACGPSQAQEPANGDAAVGVGLICNTSQQAEQFIALRSKGAAPEKAMNAVNATAHDGHACGVAAIAYVRDQTVGTRKLKNMLVQIVRINVVAGFNGAGWQRVADMVQYAVLEGGGESV